MEDSSRVPSGEVNDFGGSGLKVELSWMDKAGDQVRDRVLTFIFISTLRIYQCCFSDTDANHR